MRPLLYDRFRNTAARLLTRFDQGGTGAVVQAVVTNPDPLAPPAVNNTPQPVRAVVRGVSAELVANTPDMALGDLQVITDALSGFVPAEGQAVLINGHQRAILRVEPVPASGAAVIYKFFVR